MPNLDPLAVKLQIEQLFREHPMILEDQILLADSVEGQTDAFKFLSTVLREIQEVQGLVRGTDLIMEELVERKGRFIDRIEGLRRLAFKVLQMTGLRKIELPQGTLGLRAGTPKVLILDESAIPDSLCRFKREPDKTKIKAALESGHVPGATMSNAEETLAIRTR